MAARRSRKRAPRGVVEFPANITVKDFAAQIEALAAAGSGRRPAETKSPPKGKTRLAGKRTEAGGLLQPDLALALCLGPEPERLDDLVESLGSDLEEMRWDGGSRASTHSKLIPELEALVDDAGDPYAVSEKALAALVKQHSAPVDSPRAERYREEIEQFSEW